MIKKLKLKLLFTIMSFVTVIISLFVTAVCVIPVERSKNDAREFLKSVTENKIDLPPDSGMPPKVNEFPDNFNNSAFHNSHKKGNDVFGFSNIITVVLDDENNIVSWVSEKNIGINDEFIASLVSTALSKNSDFGKAQGHYFYKVENENRFLFMDNNAAFANDNRTVIVAVSVGFAAWLIFLILSVILTEKMTKPINEAFVKQRQFLSDAGHELKTPVSVVLANADVLKQEIGENKWLGYIATEARRMESLVGDIMDLAKLEDEETKELNKKEFDLSSAVTSAALPFESLSFEKGMTMEFDIQENIRFTGDEEKISELVVIFLSNAIKYGEEKGVIKVSLKKIHKKIHLSFYNTGVGVEEDEKEKIFDRFYRVDKARSRENGSYGLGLSIAKAIVEEHGGNISVESRFKEWIEFSVIL